MPLLHYTYYTLVDIRRLSLRLRLSLSELIVYIIIFRVLQKMLQSCPVSSSSCH